MQNYLHSKKHKKTYRITFVFTVLSVMVILVYICHIWLKNSNHAQAVHIPAYLDKNTGSVQTAVTNNGEISMEVQEEMNNERVKNAKIYNINKNQALKTSSNAGIVKVMFDDGIIREMQVEEYVKGCVLGEMPLSFEPQALMAQSVAVRSFTCRRMLLGTSKHRNAHVCTDFNCCQSYISPESINISEENKEKLENAVNVTRGIVAIFDGEPIEAAYHASSGSCTLDSEDVWGGRVEYLRSVKSPEGEQELYENGYGHRVGMSQHGANLLAKQGKSYIDIINYYYSGVNLGFM